MTPPGAGSSSEERKEFVVKCERCSFERTAAGRAEATRIGNDHRRETAHEVLAVEMPRSLSSS